MYLSDISKALPIKENVSVITNMKIHILLEIDYILEVKLFVERIHEMSGPTQAQLYVTQINSTRSHFIGTIELTVFESFENRFEIEVLKIGSLKLKFEI